MPAVAIVVALVLVGVGVLAAREKARQRDREIAGIRGADLPEARPTPLSQGLVDLVAVAGGVYLSLTMVASFVGFTVPGRMAFLGSQVDPVAALSVLLAVLEPFISRVFERAGA